MDWKDVGNAIGKFAPVLGGLIGGPLGAGIGGLISTALGVDNNPDAIQNAINTDPQASIKIKEIEANQSIQLAQIKAAADAIQTQAEASAVESVNKTMQAEVQAPHWLSWAWRPIIGLTVGFNIALCSLMAVGVLFIHDQGVLGQMPAIIAALTGISATALPVLGIAEWHTGRAKVVAAGKT